MKTIIILLFPICSFAQSNYDTVKALLIVADTSIFLKQTSGYPVHENRDIHMVFLWNGYMVWKERPFADADGIHQNFICYLDHRKKRLPKSLIVLFNYPKHK